VRRWLPGSCELNDANGRFEGLLTIRTVAVFLFDSSAHRLDIVDLNAEMIESAGITGPSPQKCQADIAVVLE
jgi:hypothetical protein